VTVGEPVFDQGRRSGQPKNKEWAWVDIAGLVGLAAIALLSRVLWLDARELFRDEAASWYLASLSLPDLLDRSAAEPYPPLYHVLLKAWIALAGDSESGLRGLSALASVASLVFGWRWATDALGARQGIFALALLTVSPLALSEGHDVRMYSLESAWATLGWWMVWRLTSRPSSRWRRLELLLLAIAVVGEVWTFAFGLVVAGLHFIGAVVLALRRSNQRWIPLVVALAGASIVPWLPNLLTASGGEPFWTPTPTLLQLAQTIGGFAVDTSGIVVHPSIVLGPLVAIVAGVGLYHFALGASADPTTWSFRLSPTLVTVGLGVGLVPLVWVASQFFSVYDTRYFGAALAPFALAFAAGLGVAIERMRVPVRALALAFLTVSGVATSGWWLVDWVEARHVAPAEQIVSALQARVTQGDVIVAVDARSFFPIAYLLSRSSDPVSLTVPTYAWHSASDPFYYGQALLEPTVRLDEATGEFPPPGLSRGRRIWLVALANGTNSDLGFAPLTQGAALQLGQIVVMPKSEAGQIRELIIPDEDHPES